MHIGTTWTFKTFKIQSSLEAQFNPESMEVSVIRATGTVKFEDGFLVLVLVLGVNAFHRKESGYP